MRTWIKGSGFLIIGIGAIVLTILSVALIVAVLGAVLVGWAVTLPVQHKFRNWRSERRSQVR